MDEYKNRRTNFQKQMDSDSIAIFYSAPPAVRSNDVDHPYRQNSDFYYLTGFTEENAILCITKDTSILFLQKRDQEKETWNGTRLGVENALEFLQVDQAYPIEDFSSEIENLLRGKIVLYYSFGENRDNDWFLLQKAKSISRQSRAGATGPSRIIHAGEITHSMRLRKTEFEKDLLRKSAGVTVEAHKQAMAAVAPGMMEYELEAVIAHTFRKFGAVEGYPSIVAAGKNACILHYTENSSRIEKTDLILIDAGSELQYMNADVSRTFPASGTFGSSQSRVYDIVLQAQNSAIARCKPHNTLQDIHDAALATIIEGLKDLELLKEEADQILEQKLYRRFFMHKTGHWLGMDVHDVGNYFADQKPIPLEKDMVFTVEPGLYIPDEDDLPAEFRGIGIRIEDDVVITDDEPEILTTGVPRERTEIEQWMSHSRDF